MATRSLIRSAFTATKQSLASAVSRSYTNAVHPNSSSSSFLFRLRPLVAASCLRRVPPIFSTRGFATRQTRSSLNDSNPNWSNRPPKETILLDGCDFEHWLVVMEKPEGDQTRDDIIDSYIKTLALVVGSEEEARMKIYSVSTRHYFAFGAFVSEEQSYKLKELPRVRWVLPDSYLDVRNKDYGGEPFINGQAVPYDPRYHAEWVRNNENAQKRNKYRNGNNSNRTTNIERREIQMNYQNSGGNFRGPSGNTGNPPFNPGQMQPNTPMQQPYMHPQKPNMGAHPPSASMGNYYPSNNMGPNIPPNYQHRNGPSYQSGPGPNRNYNPNMGSGFGPNEGGSGHGQYPNSFSPNQGGYIPNTRPPTGQNQSGYATNGGHGPVQNQNIYAPNMGGGELYGANQNVPGRDAPQSPSY